MRWDDGRLGQKARQPSQHPLHREGRTGGIGQLRCNREAARGKAGGESGAEEKHAVCMGESAMDYEGAKGMERQRDNFIMNAR